MRKFTSLKFVSQLLLLVMLTMTLNAVHESAHAMQGDIKPETSGISATHHCPCSPFEHTDYDGCHHCINCACHAPLAVQHMKFSYNPSLLNILIYDPFKFLPEVYLSKFIPPQILA